MSQIATDAQRVLKRDMAMADLIQAIQLERGLATMDQALQDSTLSYRLQVILRLIETLIYTFLVVCTPMRRENKKQS